MLFFFKKNNNIEIHLLHQRDATNGYCEVSNMSLNV